ncbi:MAG: NUMOD4 motif-containing HNH endonuclease [Dysgonamonadaceae bacterium]|nr:NUMOD4 motif-containing HNH endonuclease [Dysgonamonadaceae bacterium]
MNNNNRDSNLDKSFGNERWKPIKGYPDYRVSDRGRIKSFQSGKERLLKPQLNNSGYLRVMLFNEGKKSREFIHRLVLEAFVQNPEEKQECNHKNGIKTDNRLENLEYVTRSENMKHADETGLRNIKGENNPSVKLTANNVLEILDALNAGLPQWKIAAKFNVTQPTISDINTGKKWSHITGKTYKRSYSKNRASVMPISGKSAQQSALGAWV